MQHLPLVRASAAVAVLFLATLGLTGCNDEPSPIGSEYLPETVRFASYVVSESEMEILSAQARIANATSRGASTVLVGLAADGTVAHGLFAITEPLKSIEGPAPREVTAASFRFRTLPYRFGDLAGRQTTFDVVAIDEVALDTLVHSPALAAKIEAATPIGTYTGVLPDSAVVSVPLNLDEARNFLRTYYEYDPAAAGTLVIRRTLALRAKTGSTVVTSLLGATFADVADSLRPALVVTMGDSVAELRAGVSSWVADIPATVGAGQIVVAGGEPIRTYLQVNPTGLPLGATIHQARLVLSVDTAASRVGTSGPTTYAVLLDADGGARSTLLPRAAARVMNGFRRALDENTFTDLFEFSTVGPSITSAVRSRRAGGAAVAPFVLSIGRGTGGRADQETSTVDRLVFHGMNAADTAARPKLIIIYSTQTDAP